MKISKTIWTISGIILSMGIILTVLFLVPPNGDSFIQRDGKIFYLKGGNFSVFLPSEPTYSSSNGGGFGNFYNSTTENAHFSAYHTIPVFDNRPDNISNLEHTLTNRASFQGYETLSIIQSNFKGYPSIDYRLSKESIGVFVVGRSISTPSGLYELNYVYSGQENTAIENKFFGSLYFGKLKGSTELSYERDVAK